MDTNEKKILVAEDDPAMSEIVGHKLEVHGFKVVHASNGVEALSVFSEEKPDLILLDLMMPEMDGFGVLEEVRGNKDEKLSKTPVIVLSNLWSNQDILRTQGLKANGYLVKAYFTPEEIAKKVEDVLNGKSID